MIHIGRVEIVTDHPVSDRHARSASASFARALGAAIQRDTGGDRRVHVEHLQLALPSHALGDRHALHNAAQLVSRRILDGGAD
ncbi:MAG: hypothetical protein ACREBE_14075 [bacterium]